MEINSSSQKLNFNLCQTSPSSLSLAKGILLCLNKDKSCVDSKLCITSGEQKRAKCT